MVGSPRPERGGVVGVAGFSFQPQQPTNLGDRPWSKNPNRPLQLRIANLMKPGPLEQGEGGLPSLLQPWVPRMSSAPFDQESSSGDGWPIGKLQLRVATANEASLRRQIEKRPKGGAFCGFIALAILEGDSPPCVPDLRRGSLDDVRHLRAQTGLAPLVRPRSARPVGWVHRLPPHSAQSVLLLQL